LVEKGEEGKRPIYAFALGRGKGKILGKRWEAHRKHVGKFLKWKTAVRGRGQSQRKYLEPYTLDAGEMG